MKLTIYSLVLLATFIAFTDISEAMPYRRIIGISEDAQAFIAGPFEGAELERERLEKLTNESGTMYKVSSCEVVKETILVYMYRSNEYSRDASKYETRANSLVLLYISMGCDARSLALDIPRNIE